jgi:hypothetical protein
MRCKPKVARPSPRRGWATLWLIIWLPALLALFCALICIANLWLARVEAENAMEAAALAAVKQWGDASGGDTLIPRQIGQDYAAANCVRKVDVAIGTNYDNSPAGGPNQNAACDVGMAPPTGNLIFGAIDDTDPNNVIFNAGIQPSCGIGTVLFDASAQGPGNLLQDNAWGIAFFNTPTTPANLRIVKVIYDLQANGGTGLFDLGAVGPADGPTITDNVSPHLLSVTCMGTTYEQPDLVGFTNPTAQIVFSPASGLSPTLTITFLPDGLADDGFAPCDRFRFGALTTGVGAGTPQGGDDDDGDGIGQDLVQVTVFFEQGGVPILPPATGTFINNDEKSNQCICPPLTDPSCTPNPLIVHPLLIPNLPCPPASGNNNNGQSYVLLSGSGNRKFGVRAQSIIPVADFGCVFLGTVPPGCVQTKATAIYDCTTRRPRLIRIDKFICPGPVNNVTTCDFCAPGP